jgi:hypothetical protein
VFRHEYFGPKPALKEYRENVLEVEAEPEAPLLRLEEDIGGQLDARNFPYYCTTSPCLLGAR